jgi:hypothetical protein
MAYLNVQIDLSEFDSDPLMEEIENRGYRIMLPGEIDADIEAFNKTLDDIHDLYQSFCAWKDGGVKNEYFENDLKSFFLDTIDMRVL